jgi:transposase-like protein
MAARKRSSKEAVGSSESEMTYTRFLELFPDNDVCLEYLRAKFFPDGSECPGCGRATKWHRIRSRAAYSCQFCGHHAYPTAGTIFHKSTVNLQLWFWAIFLMSSTRCGISAKQLEREIGVSYPTAHRMFKQIRTLLTQDDTRRLEGKVEVDETFVGGKPRAGRRLTMAEHSARKTAVFGAVQRGGQVRTTIIPNTGSLTLRDATRRFVLPQSILFTDDYPGYVKTGREYQAHRRVRHSANVYVDGDATTNTIEAFFGLIKNGLRGVYHSVSTRYLQSYLDEFTFRFNGRVDGRPIFWAILDRVERDHRLGAA